MRRVLPGGATLGGGDARPVACRPGAAVLERTRPVDPTKTGDGQTEGDGRTGGGETPQKPPTSWLRENFEKVVIPVIIAVLTAVILAWLGLNK